MYGRKVVALLGLVTAVTRAQDSVSSFRPLSIRPPRSSAESLRVPRLTPAPAPKQQPASQWSRGIDYSGPRFGFTYLPPAAVDSLKAHRIDGTNIISQFGWQLEHEVQVSETGPMVLNEWVFLAGGLERGIFLPSLTWLVGARGQGGNEIGFGPNVSIAGVGMALAAGITVNNGGLHVPLNIAAASAKGGVRVSFLTGFTLH
jgi:hypothetical protein